MSVSLRYLGKGSCFRSAAIFVGAICLGTWMVAYSIVFSRAEATVYLTVDGEVNAQLSLSESDFKALPRQTMIAKDEAGHDQSFEGVALSTLLLRAGVPLKS